VGVRILAQIGETVFWFSSWIFIPAALLFPVVVWMLENTQYSETFLIQGYGLAVAALFLPTGFLVDFLYRKLIRNKRNSN
jgi:hypothetical protein